MSQAPRCNVKGEDNIRAWYGGPAASGHLRTDSGAWHKKGDDEKDCAWVASHLSEARCLVRGEDDTPAEDALPVGVRARSESSCPSPFSPLPLRVPNVYLVRMRLRTSRTDQGHATEDTLPAGTTLYVSGHA